MKTTNMPIIKYFVSEELPFSERILSFVAFVGTLAMLVSLMAHSIEGMPLANLLIMLFLLSVIFTIFIVSVKRLGHVKMLTDITVFGMGAVLFPILFFYSGGADSGMAAHFTLAIVCAFLLLKGRRRVTALIAISVITFFCYQLTLVRGVQVFPVGGLDQRQRFYDNIQAIFVVGFFVGSVIVFQNSVYMKEKSKAETRLAGQQLMSVITKMFLSKKPMGELIDPALARVGGFLGVDRVIIAAFEEYNDFSHPTYYWLSDPKYTPKSELLKETFDMVIRSLFPENLHEKDSAKICCGNTISFDSGKFKFFYEHEGLKAFICAPIYTDGKLWGVLGCEDYERFRDWNESDVQLVNALTSSISNRVVRDVIEKERTSALESALAASRAKGDFLSNMSHEIRTPMNAIIGMTSIGMSSHSLEKKDYAFDKINDASKHLLGIINDILDMSKIEANKLELSPGNFEFEKMLINVVNFINFRIDERKQRLYVHIDRNIPRMLVGDDQRLAQVITNLLSNAVKFTPDEGEIRLDAHVLQSKNGTCRIQIDVTDTGIGMDEIQMSRLFRSFEQADSSTSRKYGGTGLGLSISKRIVEMMGGEIWVESELGLGTKFSFIVELERGEGKQECLLSGDVNWKNIRIFAVDDDAEILKFFTDVSANLDIHCKVARSGEDAAKMLAEDDNYNLYFLDWKLPGMSGIDLARKINKKADGSSTVIIFSSVDWSTIEDDARAAGVAKFLPKPLFQSNVVDLINECLGCENMPMQESEDEVSDDFTGHTILLAEDVEINREILMSLLEPTNLRIECAGNGVEALDMFEAEPERYDMIFMDIHMPEMDGFEATRKIRSLHTERARDIPIVAMTANVFREDIELCMDAGMDAHLGKPLDITEVLEVLHRYLAVGNMATVAAR